jgi:hypothetical protein
VKTKAPRSPRAKPAPLGPTVRAALGVLGRGALALVRSPDMGRLAVSALVAAGFMAASWRVRAHVLEQPELSIDPHGVASTPLPAFLSDRARDDLAALPLPSRVSAYDPAFVYQLSVSLERLPWVEGVDQVAIGFAPGATGFEPRIHFALRAAHPIARMDERGVEVLVSRSRRRIPTDRVVPTSRPLPRIDGLPDDPFERELTLDQALGVIAALERRGVLSKLALDSVVVARGDRHAARVAGATAPPCEVTLVLGSGTKVEWGPAGDMPGLLLEERVGKLEGFLARGPALEQVERISVRWDDPVYVLKPVAADAPVARGP